MDNLFFIIGLVLFVAASIAVWAKAYKKSMTWGVVTMIVPAACIPFYFVEWQKTRIVAMVHVMGIGFLVGGFLLYSKDNPQPLNWLTSQTEEVLKFDILKQKEASVFSSHLASAQGDRRVLSGMTIGGPFVLEQGAYKNGTLRLGNGHGFVTQSEIAIKLDVPIEKLYSSPSYRVRPDDTDAPSLAVSWSQYGSKIPETIIYNSGYWMELTMDLVESNEVRGFVQILFPSDPGHIVSGEFFAYTDDLRYLYGKLDRAHDSSQTIDVIAREAVATYHRLPHDSVRIKSSRIYEDRGGVVASTTAQYRDSRGKFREEKITLNKLTGIWLTEPPYDRATLLAKANELIRDDPPAAAQVQTQTTENKITEVLQIPVDEFVPSVADYQGRSLKVETTAGVSHEGVMVRHTITRLVLLTRVGSGEVEFFVPFDELKSVEVQP